VNSLVDFFSEFIGGFDFRVSVAKRTQEKHTPHLISVVIARLVLEVGDVCKTWRIDEIGLRVCTKYCFLS
jgi:hypothetical protein